MIIPGLCSDPSQSDPETKDFWLNMAALTEALQRQAEQNPAASYYNVVLLRYQVGQVDGGGQRGQGGDGGWGQGEQAAEMEADSSDRGVSCRRGGQCRGAWPPLVQMAPSCRLEEVRSQDLAAGTCPQDFVRMGHSSALCWRRVVTQPLINKEPLGCPRQCSQVS